MDLILHLGLGHNITLRNVFSQNKSTIVHVLYIYCIIAGLKKTLHYCVQGQDVRSSPF
jgi:hypothetical protein